MILACVLGVGINGEKKQHMIDLITTQMTLDE